MTIEQWDEGAPQTTGRSITQGHGYSILVVEDDPSMLEIVSLVLEDEDYHVLTATNGNSALGILQESSPDIIISDVMMPEMDGYTFYERVRANEEWMQIPFIFLTAKGQRTDIRHGMGLGADDYLIKPFEPEDLIAAVQVRLARAAQTQTAIHKASADLRTKIIRSLSHEFRTPLSMVMGYGELLEVSTQETSDNEFHQMLHGLRTSSQRLMSLVEDFLLLSRIETGALGDEIKLMPNRTPNPDDVVTSVETRCQKLADAQGVSIITQLNTQDSSIAIDREYLFEVVLRILDNAIKFSQDGGQIILNSWQDSEFWVLDIMDNGIGIRQEMSQHVFEAFRQIDRDLMEQQGAGLGLAIAKGLLDLYHGEITVQSEPNVGSTFTVRIPLVQA